MRIATVLKWIAVVVVCLIVAVQFIRPVRSNPIAVASESVNAHLQMTPQVVAILDRSCNDCHSNNTRWPWYSNVAPVSWFVIDHVNHGRTNLNFSEWSRMNQRASQRMLQLICKEVRGGAMPLDSYTLIHRNAKLSAADVQSLCDWTEAERSRITAR